MKLIGKVICLALLMNALHGFGQEGVRYKSVQAGGLNTFYREAGPTSGPVILLLHGVPTSGRRQPGVDVFNFALQNVSQR